MSRYSTIAAQTTSPGTATVRVWDLGVRLFHWSLLTSVSLAWIVTDPRKLHRGFGYAVLGLLAFRVVWGLVGPRHARFADFIPTPRRLIAYLAAMLRGAEPRTLGHNPAGAAMIVVLILTLAAIGTTGIMMGMDRYFGQDWLEHWHKTLVDGLIVLVLLHLAGVILSSLRHRENLVAAMIHGRKSVADPSLADSDDRGALRRGLFLAAAALQFGCGAVFVYDLAYEFGTLNRDTLLEATGVVALAIGLVLSLREYRLLARRNALMAQRNRSMARQLGVASGAFGAMLAEQFDLWALTPAERDVALMAIKGMSVAQIAQMRDTRAGTIKAQSAAVYRKAGVSSRAELISVLIEDLIAGIGLPEPV